MTDNAWPPALPWPAAPLTDGGIRLDPMASTDVARTVQACSDEQTQRWLPLPHPYSEADAMQFIGSRVDAADRGEELTLAFRGIDEDLLAGVVGLSQRGQRNEAAIGYWTVPDRRGRGWTARAVRLIATYALATMPLRRLEIFMDPENIPSRRVAESAGAVFECVRRNGMPTPHGGDALQFSLVPSDLEPPAAAPVGFRAP